jgi:hypothetical protein|tara:strand:- start:341 stop:655 length:315 start_codon:yes stop_codon:yes gene_type:complete
MSEQKASVPFGVAAKIGVFIVPLFATGAVALYRVDQAEDRLSAVEVAVKSESENRAQDVEKMAYEIQLIATDYRLGQREVLENLTEIKIKVGVLCHAVDGARCP